MVHKTDQFQNLIFVSRTKQTYIKKQKRVVLWNFVKRPRWPPHFWP